jgi:hypothetical protein
MVPDPPLRTRLTQLAVLVLVIAALFVGAFGKGLGPCGPTTFFGTCCMAALLFAIMAAFILFVIIVVERFTHK